MAIEAGHYTEAILNENFLAIEDFMANVARTVNLQVDVTEKLAQRIEQVALASKVVVRAPKRSKLLAVVVVGGAFYAGYKFATTKVDEEKVKKVADKIVDKVEGSVYGDRPSNTRPTNTRPTQKD